MPASVVRVFMPGILALTPHTVRLIHLFNLFVRHLCSGVDSLKTRIFLSTNNACDMDCYLICWIISLYAYCVFFHRPPYHEHHTLPSMIHYSTHNHVSKGNICGIPFLALAVKNVDGATNKSVLRTFRSDVVALGVIR